MKVRVRPLTREDAAPLALLLAGNRAYLAPFEPVRPDSFFTEAGQRERLEALRAERDTDRGYAAAIEYEGALVGTIGLFGIVRGAAQCATLGYWVAEHAAGKGIATAAVGEMLSIAFDELGLHRIDSATLVDNVRSQRVLENNGFERTGLAPRYMLIDGDWRDHLLFQRLAD